MSRPDQRAVQKEACPIGDLPTGFAVTLPEDHRASYYRARYYDATIGRLTREDPLRFGSGDPNFYGYVSQNPINYTDPSGKTRIYGNWCGPDWTGGIREPFNPKHLKDYKKPIDSVDEACMHHDICYFNCRTQYPCAQDARANCMRKCDNLLTAEIPTKGFWGIVVWWGIELHVKPGPGSNLGCGCYNITWVK